MSRLNKIKQPPKPKLKKSKYRLQSFVIIRKSAINLTLMSSINYIVGLISFDQKNNFPVGKCIVHAFSGKSGIIVTTSKVTLWWFLNSHILQFSGSKPPNKYLCVGNLLRSVHFHLWLGVICISHRKYADVSAVHNPEIGGDESQKARCRTMDVPPFTPCESEGAN